MIRYIKRIDTFGRNIILVFLGSSLVNVFNLLFQLLLAHRMSSVDFAGFSSLLAIFTLISAPLITLQTAVTKYTAEFSAQKNIRKIRALLSSLLRMILPLALVTFIIFYFLSFGIMDRLKIPSVIAGYILALLITSCWITPVLTGALQGLELFKWLMLQSVISGAAKLVFGVIFIGMGFNIAGGLGAFLAAILIGILISVFPLKTMLSFRKKEESVNLKEFFIYLAPVATGSFCFIALVSLDMVLVKYLFTPVDAGFYSLAQIVGKIFLFFPGAITIVMFPRTAGLKAKNMSTGSTLMRSLLYASVLCVIANIAYNLFPSFILKLLTGKIYGESVALGRLFGVSMSFFALSFILINYFLSVKDLRFMKYLVLSTLLEPLAIVLFHRNLMYVQLILCVNSALLFFTHLLLAYKREAVPG
ncbi:MAG: oligosaccharide flippase family protein [Candidatus Omnitrophota bacterium]